MAGGHVGILIRCLRLFAVGPPPELPVVAWSAGAMALTERVVLYNDRGPQGVQGAEVWDRGAGRVRDVVAMPHARRRLRLDDPVHAKVFVAPVRPGDLPAARRRDTGGDHAGRPGPCPTALGCSRETGPSDGGPGDAVVTNAIVPALTGDRANAMTRAATKLAINRLLERKPLDGASIDRFIERHGGAPVIEGSRATFLWRGHADEVSVRHRVVGLPDPLRLRHVKDTDLWYVTTDIPEGSRIEYSFEVTRDDHTESFLNDPLNPKLAHGPFGSSSVCAAAGYHVPDWTQHDPEARPGRGRRAHHHQQGAASPGDLPALPARPASARSCATRWWSCTTASTTSTTPRPRPCSTTSSTATRSPRWWSRSSRRRATGWSSTPTTRRTPGSSPASWCPS